MLEVGGGVGVGEGEIGGRGGLTMFVLLSWEVLGDLFDRGFVLWLSFAVRVYTSRWMLESVAG